jgi:hypothetical protein
MGKAVELRRVGGRKQALNLLPKASPLALRLLTTTVAANRDSRCALNRFPGLPTSSGERSSIVARPWPNHATNPACLQLQCQSPVGGPVRAVPKSKEDYAKVRRGALPCRNKLVSQAKGRSRCHVTFGVHWGWVRGIGCYSRATAQGFVSGP